MSIVLNDIASGYDGFRLRSVTLEIADQSMTALIGPNGCGKSTLLKTIARQLDPRGGKVTVGGTDISTLRTKEVAQRIAVLPQHPVVPPGITVEQLVSYGRAPHQNLLGFRTEADDAKIEEALRTVAITGLAHRLVSDLSGGQRQRAFLAMVIAQDTPYVLFDEPTSFLDIRYQYEVLDLMAALNRSGKTVVAVLHDISQAARYATDVVVMEEGQLRTHGAPRDTVTEELLSSVYGIRATIFDDPVTGTPMVSPLAQE
ncbi:MAG: ABC transporter ATP-binding protein [Pseudomonadota bacterium]